MNIIKQYKKMAAQIIAISAALVSLNGCATIAGDNTRTIAINSVPNGASIYVDNQRHGTTPATVTLPNYIYGGKTVVLKKQGHPDQILNVNTKFQPCGLWNLLFWPGFLIDAATGSSVKIDPTCLNLHANIAPEPLAS